MYACENICKSAISSNELSYICPCGRATNVPPFCSVTTFNSIGELVYAVCSHGYVIVDRRDDAE